MNAKTVLIERIGKVETRSYNGADGKARALVSMDMPYRKDKVTDAQGNTTWNTTWVNVTMPANDYTNKLAKGDLVQVEGEIIADIYKKQDGTPALQYKFKNASVVVILKGERIMAAQPQATQPVAQGQPAPMPTPQTPAYGYPQAQGGTYPNVPNPQYGGYAPVADVSDDDLPF